MIKPRDFLLAVLGLTLIGIVFMHSLNAVETANVSKNIIKIYTDSNLEMHK